MDFFQYIKQYEATHKTWWGCLPHYPSLSKMIPLIVIEISLGGLNHRNVFVHSSGGWASKDHGASWIGFVRHLFLACRLLPSHCVFTWLFLCAHLSLPLFNNDISPIRVPLS